jgi:hypothetical protein
MYINRAVHLIVCRAHIIITTKFPTSYMMHNVKIIFLFFFNNFIVVFLLLNITLYLYIYGTRYMGVINYNQAKIFHLKLYIYTSYMNNNFWNREEKLYFESLNYISKISNKIFLVDSFSSFFVYIYLTCFLILIISIQIIKKFKLSNIIGRVSKVYIAIRSKLSLKVKPFAKGKSI